jgi:hypothetical protein
MLTASHLTMAMAFLVGAPAMAQVPATIGVNAAIRNQVRIKTYADPALRPAVVREPVHIGDAVVSGPQSALQMLLRDRTVFTIGANARVTIDRFVYDPNRGTSDVAVSVAKGAFRFMSGPSLRGAGRNAITTPVGSIGVRGTIVEGVVGSDVRDLLQGVPGVPSFSGPLDNATFIALIGPGAGADGFDKVGAIDFRGQGPAIEIARAGQGLLIWDGAQPPYGPFDIPDVVFTRLLAQLGVAGGSGGGGPAGGGPVGDSPPALNGVVTAGEAADPGYAPPGLVAPVAGTSALTPGGPLPPPVVKIPVNPPIGNVGGPSAGGGKAVGGNAAGGNGANGP